VWSGLRWKPLAGEPRGVGAMGLGPLCHHSNSGLNAVHRTGNGIPGHYLDSLLSRWVSARVLLMGCSRKNVRYDPSGPSQVESCTAVVEDIGAEGRVVSKTEIFENLQGVCQQPGLRPRNMPSRSLTDTPNQLATALVVRQGLTMSYVVASSA
jgi:hypothetical protein